MTPEDLAITVGLAGAAIASAWFFAYIYYRKSSKETAGLKHELAAVKSQNRVIMEQNKADDPKSVKYDDNREDGLTAIKRTITHTTDSLIAEGKTAGVIHR
ncbi:MAG TPA: hypothetical protein VMJ94_07905 [Nitrososphaera sp.]|nr:hypothetical protein [Nitrososphaera sp.]